ncbi:MAG: SDR family oxidoreductase [Polyangiaceae bacterium]
MRNKDYRGKVAAITGAASGIGRSLATALAREGCDLALSDVNESGLVETARLCSRVRVTERRLDVADGADFRAWAAEVVRDFGRVNLLFNNAGVSYGATVGGGEEEEIRRVVDIDFWGVAHGTRAFLPHLAASGDGHVVNISSVFGLFAFPGQSAYNAAKFAVRGFTEALRIELEMTDSPVTATCVHPGGIKTNIMHVTKSHGSLADLGVDVGRANKEMEKAFRTTSDRAAEIILKGVKKNERRVLVGTDAHILDLVQRFLPGTYHGIFARIGRRRAREHARAREKSQ